MFPHNRKRSFGALCSVLLCLPAEAREAPSLCGESRTRRIEEQFLWERAQWRRLASTGSALSLATPVAGVTRDVGDIAIVDDSAGVRIRRNPFSLQFKRLIFTPVDAGYTLDVQDAPDPASIDINAGTRLDKLDDDDTREVPLPFAFSFYGNAWNSVFVNSDGNLTFGVGDALTSDRNLSRMTAGPPRISPCFADFDPTASDGGVRVVTGTDAVTVLWSAVPFWGTNRRPVFQVTLRSDGRIEFLYGGSFSDFDGAVVGIAPGGSLGDVTLIPLVGGSSTPYRAAVAEVFAPAETYDVALATQKFFQTHEDSYDYLFVFNALHMVPSLCPTAIACTDVARNRETRHGRPLIDAGVTYGSPNRLEAVIDMGPVENYPEDPFVPLPLRAGTGDKGINILGHEASHRFLAWVSPLDGSGAPLLLGRQLAHWAFNFNSQGSLVEGNRIIDNGAEANPRFLAAGAGERIAPFDQYFFGWKAPQDVPDSFVVLNSTGPTGAAAPRPGTRFNGTRRDVALRELTDVAGPRWPDSELARRRFRFGVVVIVPEGQPLPDASIAKIERYRQAFPGFWDQVSEGQSVADIAIKRSLRVSFAPYAVFATGGPIEASVSISGPLESALTVSIESTAGGLALPGQVVIPPGETSVRFEIGADGPVTSALTFRPSDDAFETVEVRVRARNP